MVQDITVAVKMTWAVVCTGGSAAVGSVVVVVVGLAVGGVDVDVGDNLLIPPIEPMVL